MDQAKAAQIASAIITAGFRAEIFIRTDGQWVINAKNTGGFDVPLAAAEAFAEGNAVTAFAKEVQLI